MTIFHHQRHFDPWNPEPPPWAVALQQQGALILERLDIIMALSDDLNNAVTSLAAGFAAEHTAVSAELTAFAAKLATIPAAADPAITAAVAQAISNITTITGSLATDAAALTASIPAATTVPAPAVA